MRSCRRSILSDGFVLGLPLKRVAYHSHVERASGLRPVKAFADNGGLHLVVNAAGGRRSRSLRLALLEISDEVADMQSFLRLGMWNQGR